MSERYDLVQNPHYLHTWMRGAAKTCPVKFGQSSDDNTFVDPRVSAQTHPPDFIRKEQSKPEMLLSMVSALKNL